MSTNYFMRVKSIGLSKVAGRKPCTLSFAAKHNKRELAHELEERGRIDPERTRLNYPIAGAIDSTGVVAMALQLMESVGTSPEQKRRDYCQAIEIVFSLPANTTIDIKRYFDDCFKWCCATFGAENILSVDVHLDESTPHCHALIAPIQSGRWTGSKLIDHANTKALNESFAKQVASVYGFKMMERLSGSRKGEAVAKVLEHIESHDRELLQSPAWPPIRQTIERNPAPFLTAYGLELENKPPANLKTMAQIFTSAGKGAKRETLHLPKRNPVQIDAQAVVNKSAHANPIGIQSTGEKHQSLSCVGIAPLHHTKEPDSVRIEVTRVREFELDPSAFDPETGEFYQRPEKPAQHQKQAAQFWVKSELQNRGRSNADCSQHPMQSLQRGPKVFTRNK